LKATMELLLKANEQSFLRGEKLPYCWKCGAEVKEDVNFCPKCGAPVSERAKREKKRVEWWE